jgi:hypothetical protein
MIGPEMETVLKSAFIEGYLRTGGSADDYTECEKAFKAWLEAFKDDLRAQMRAPKGCDVNLGYINLVRNFI